MICRGQGRGEPSMPGGTVVAAWLIGGIAHPVLKGAAHWLAGTFLFSLVAPAASRARLLARVPPGAPQRLAHQAGNGLLQAPAGDRGRFRHRRNLHLRRVRRLGRGGCLVFAVPRAGRLLLPLEPAHRALAGLVHPAARAPRGAPPAGRARLRLRRHHAVRPAVRHLPRGGRLRAALRLFGTASAAAGRDAALRGRARAEARRRGVRPRGGAPGCQGQAGPRSSGPRCRVQGSARSGRAARRR